MGKIKNIRKAKEGDGKIESKNKPINKTNQIMKFAFQTPADKNKYHTFATIKDHILNQIQCDYEDGKFLAKAIRTGVLEVYEKPKRERSTLVDEDERAFEQDTFNQDYKNATVKYERKMENLQDNMASTYILIFDDCCTKDLQQRIEQHPDF